MDDAAFLGHFWDLGSSDPTLRRNAGSAVLLSLSECAQRADSAAAAPDTAFLSQDQPAAGSKKEFQYKIPKEQQQLQHASTLFLRSLEYATNRLIHGLSSGREAVRIGFAATLSVILCRYSAFIPLDTIVDAIHRTTVLPKGILGEHRDLLIGRVFGYSTVEKAGYFKTRASQTHIETVVSDLLDVLDHKTYLQDAAMQTLGAVLSDFETVSPGVGIKMLGQRLSSLGDFATAPAKKTGVTPPFGLLYLYFYLYRRQQSSSTECPKTSLRDPLSPSFLSSSLAILLHPSTVWSCHPKIPAAWFDLFLLLATTATDNAMDLLQSTMKQLNADLFFSAGATTDAATAAMQSPQMEEKEEEEDGSGTMQRTFYGFRVMLELLVVLKLIAFGYKDRGCQCLVAFWENSAGFLRQLMFHARTATPLKNAAMSCLALMTDILVGTTQTPQHRRPLPMKKGSDGSGGGPLTVFDLGCYDRLTIDPSILAAVVPQDTSTAALITQPFPLIEDSGDNDISVCHKALNAFRDAIFFGSGGGGARLDTALLTKVAAICCGSITPEHVTRFVQGLEGLNSTDEGDDHAPGQQWLWNFDMALQLALFRGPAHNAAAAHLVLKAFGSILRRANADAGKDAKLIVAVDGLVGQEGHEGITTVLVPMDADQRTIVMRRILRRFGPALGHYLVSVARPMARIVDLEGATVPAAVAAACIEQFSTEFLGPVVNGLGVLLRHGACDKKPLSVTAALRYFKDGQQAAHGAKESTAAAASGGSMPFHRLDTDDVETCLAFGILLKKAMLTIIKELLQAQTEEKSGGTETVKGLAAAASTLVSLTAVLLEPLVLAWQPKEETAKGGAAELEDAHGLLDLMRQLGAEIVPELITRPRESAKECLEACADVLPSLLLQQQQTESSFSHQRSVCRGINTTVLGTLWRVIARYAPDTCISGLVQHALRDNDAEEDHQEEEGTGSAHNGATTEDDSDSDNDDESDGDENEDETSDDGSETTTAAVSEHETDASDSEAAASDGEDDDEVTSSQALTALLMDEEEIKKDITNPFDIKQNQRRLTRHKRSDVLHTRQRALDFVQTALESRAAGWTKNRVDNGAVVPLDRFVQQTAWCAELCEGLTTLAARLVRRKRRGQHRQTDKQKDLDGLYQMLISKIEFIINHQEAKLIPATHTVSSSTMDVEATLHQLRRMATSLVAHACKVGSEPRYQQAAGCLLHTIARLEELILLTATTAVCDTKGLFQRLVAAHPSITLSATTTTDENDDKEEENDDEAMMGDDARQDEVQMPSSGLILTDVLTSCLYAWARKRRTGITERLFRGVIGSIKRHASTIPPPLALLAVPFTLVAAAAPKVFVVREAFAVQADALAVCATRLLPLLSAPKPMALSQCSLGRVIAQALLDTWMPGCLGQLDPAYQSRIVEHPSVMKLPALSHPVHTLLRSQTVATLLLATFEVTAIRSHAIPDNASSAKPEGGAPSCVPRRNNVQKNQRLMFEQQMAGVLSRVCKIVSDSTGGNAAAAEPALGAVLEEATRVAKSCFASRHKKKRRKTSS